MRNEPATACSSKTDTRRLLTSLLAPAATSSFFACSATAEARPNMPLLVCGKSRTARPPDTCHSRFCAIGPADHLPLRPAKAPSALTMAQMRAYHWVEKKGTTDRRPYNEPEPADEEDVNEYRRFGK